MKILKELSISFRILAFIGYAVGNVVFIKSLSISFRILNNPAPMNVPMNEPTTFLYPLGSKARRLGRSRKYLIFFLYPLGS